MARLARLGRPARSFGTPDAVPAVVALLAAISGVVWAAARAWRNGWVPVSDNAAIALRAQDVFSRHAPLIGMPSTLGLYAHGRSASHPGPLEFFSLAGPYALLGRTPLGLLVGVVLVNGVSILAIAWASRRLGGMVGATWALLLATVLVWGMGASVAADVWNPYLTLLPFAAFLVLATAVARGHLVAFPVALLFASYSLQAHLSYLGLVGLVMAWTVVMAVWHGRQMWRDPEADRRQVRGSLRRTALASLVVFAICWWAPLLQQFTGSKPNLSAIATGFSSGETGAAGPRFAIRALGQVVGLPPPFGLRPTSAGAFPVGRASVADLARFSLPWLLLVLGAVVAWKRRNRVASRTLVTAGVALLATTITAARAPVVSGADVVYVYNVRWLWPVAMFTWFALGLAAWQLTVDAARPPTPVRRWLAPSLCVVAVLVALVPRGPTALTDAADIRLTRELSDAVVHRIPGPGPYVVKSLGNTAFITASTGLAVALERHGIHTYISPPIKPVAAPWGEHRQWHGQHVVGTVWVMSGAGDLSPSPTARRLATASGATAKQRLEVLRLRAAILGDVERAGGLRLSDAGRRALVDASSAASRATQVQLRRAEADPSAALADGTLAGLAGAGLTAPPSGTTEQLARYEALRPLVSGAWDGAVYLDGAP